MDLTHQPLAASRASARQRHAWTFGLGALALACSAHAGIGAKLALQAWDPAHPDQERMVVPYDQADVLSDGIARAWNQYREPLCRRIMAEMGRPDQFHKGVTLYDMVCQLQPALQFAVRQMGANLLEVSFQLRGNTFIASSTTPTVMGSYGNPRVSVDFDVELRVQLAIQPSAQRTLEVVQVFAGFSQTRIDSQNLAADVAKALNDAYAFLFGTDFRQRAEAMMNGLNTDTLKDPKGRPYGELLVALANASLAPVNQALTAPSQYVRVGAWFHEHQVVLAFAPRNLPAPPLTGAVEGSIRWPASWVAQNGCASVNVSSSVQIGPRPILGPSLALGAAPMATFGSYVPLGGPMQRGDFTECRYQLSGLPLLYASQLSATAPRLVAPGQAAVSVSASLVRPASVLTVKPDAWPATAALPPVLTQGWNFVVSVQALPPKPMQMVLALPTSHGPATALPGGPGQAPMPPHGPRPMSRPMVHAVDVPTDAARNLPGPR